MSSKPTISKHSTLVEMKAFVRKHKLNHPSIKLGMKKAEMLDALDKLGHINREPRAKKEAPKPVEKPKPVDKPKPVEKPKPQPKKEEPEPKPLPKKEAPKQRRKLKGRLTGVREKTTEEIEKLYPEFYAEDRQLTMKTRGYIYDVLSVYHKIKSTGTKEQKKEARKLYENFIGYRGSEKGKFDTYKNQFEMILKTK